MSENQGKKYTVAVIGTGFVGVVTSAVMAKFGHETFGVDIDEVRVSKLSQGEVPFFEPGLEELLVKGNESGLLKFTTNYKEAIPKSKVIFIAVGTPSSKDGTANLTYVKAACESLAPLISDKTIVVIKSTVPPGTSDVARKIIAANTSKRFAVASVPEFLKEGTAVEDTLKPDRVVIGSEEKWAVEVLLDLHSPFTGKRIVVSAESAQMAKYTANAYLAQRITFINQIANLCEANGANINEVIEVIGADKRIGSHYWYPGLGYGGSCFPKDVKELAAYAKQIGQGDGLLVKIDELNEKRLPRKLNELKKAVGGFRNKNVAVLGLSFKPNTNDLREAPSTKVIPYLKDQKAIIKAYDPEAMGVAEEYFPPMFYAEDAYEAVEQVDVIFLLVEWEELSKLDLKRVAEKANPDCWLFDTRNQYEREEVERVGLNYMGIGV